MSSSVMSAILSFVIGSALVIVTLWLAWNALTSESVPVVGSAQWALIGIVIVGMAACGVAGISQAPTIGWAHPITLFGIVIGILAFVIGAAGIFGWDSVVRPFAGLVPMGSAVAATTERLAIGLLTALIVAKWIVGIPLTLLANR